MTLAAFIKQHRKELDRHIALALCLPANPLPNDAERRLWVHNDEDLYAWARSAGVKL